MTQKWTFERLYDSWCALVQIYCKRTPELAASRASFAAACDTLIADSGWTKLEFYTAIDDYHRDLNT